MASKRSRPGRTLLIFGLCVLIWYGLAALGGTWKPRLGLDLQGGTRITLTAVGNHDPKPEQLNEAADIINNRVNGSGVSESAVSTQGGKNIVVEIPGKNRKDLVSAVERTAQLRFRLVALEASGAPAPRQSSSPTASPSTGPSSSPSSSPSASGTAKPSTKAKPGTSQSASPKPRVAPGFAVKPGAKDKSKPKNQSPSPTPSAPPSAPATPQAPAGTTGAGAPVDKPLQWMDAPGAKWTQKFLAYTCPPKGKSLAPRADDPDQPLITCDDAGQKFLLSRAVIEGTELKSASAGIPQQSVGWAVDLTFKGSGAKTFGNVTQAINQQTSPLTGQQKQFAIVLDGTVLSAPTVESPILNGSAQITGNFTESSATSLATSLKYGALPIRFAQPPSVETIGPSLAGNQLSAGILAGIIGMAIVMIYCLFYYRGLGLVVIASLIIAALVTYGTVLVLAKAAGFTLTLPGIAGLIVAVGITADSFIVYFERIRDEMRSGKSMRLAVQAGWKRARNTCLAADGVSLLAAVVLYIFSIGVVKGFAFALGISTVIDVIVFFWFTHPMMTLLAGHRFFHSGHRLSGLSDETLGIDGDPVRRAGYAGGRA
ncbi:MAG TPA: protein translocase subunit SecD [Marmoricola sp.]|nr:protein translocase subunit SecD [Marmoricola sp.]